MNKLSSLLKNILGLLFIGVDGDIDDADPDTGNDLPDDPVDVDDVDLPDDDLPDDPPVRAAPRRSDADDRLARLEAEVERRGRLAEEARRAADARPDPTFEDEERRLRDPNTSELERWQIQSNRTLRATEARATQALMQAQEMQDRTRFEAKVASDPRRAKYLDRVEEEVTRAKSRGQMASREDVYYWMLGKDIAEGKVKSKPKAAAPAANVNRGKSPAVRSDVQSRGARTEHDKRVARLANMNI
jgi:hypothetical protein